MAKGNKAEPLPGVGPLIALLTDFGLSDGYVGSIKAVIWSLAPGARLLDITHDIRPQDVRGAAFVLMTVAPYLPRGAIVVAVVDPGVGTGRRAIVVEAGGRYYVAPDNGLLSYVLLFDPPQRIVALENRRYFLPRVSSTFHGRDIFSPVAAHIALGVPLAEFGPPLDSIITLPEPALKAGAGYISGEIIHIDRFGNAISSIGELERELDGTFLLRPRFGGGQEIRFRPEPCRIEVGGTSLGGIAQAYGSVPEGEPVVIVGSSGHLEIAVNGGSAADVLGLHPGLPVTLYI